MRREISPAKLRDQQMTNVLIDPVENVQATSGYHDAIPSSPLQTTMAGLTDTL